MAIIGNVDIEVACDECGKSENVDVSNDVLNKLLHHRGWQPCEGGECCKACADRMSAKDDEESETQ